MESLIEKIADNSMGKNGDACSISFQMLYQKGRQYPIRTQQNIQIFLGRNNRHVCIQLEALTIPKFGQRPTQNKNTLSFLDDIIFVPKKSKEEDLQKMQQTLRLISEARIHPKSQKVK